MPLTNTSIIHPDFSAHHQPSVETGMRSVVDILLPLSEAPAPTFPPTDEEWDEVLAAQLPARIRALSDGNTLAPSGQSYDTQGYLIQITAGTLPDLRIGKGENAHRLRVARNHGAPGPFGQVMQILAAPHESESFNRDLYCQVHVTQQQS